MDQIVISELEVRFRVGVPDEERAQPQRLLISAALETNLSNAARTDDLTQTVDYDAVCRRIRELGTDREWKLIEKLAGDVANLILEEFGVEAVTVSVKKFIFPDTNHVGVTLRRTRPPEVPW